MDKSSRISPDIARDGERGSARAKFLIIISLVIITAFVGYRYVPVRFQAGLYKDFMQDTVTKGSAMSKTSAWVKEQLEKNAAEYGVPANAEITVEEHDGAQQVRVQYKLPINLLVYTYDYEFDETVKSPAWVGK